MIRSLIVSLWLTLIIELTVSIILGIRKRDDIIIVICANALTNPIVVFIANCLVLLNNEMIYSFVVIFMEIMVVFVEGFIFRKLLDYKDKPAFLISLINNATSFLLGIVISMFI